MLNSYLKLLEMMTPRERSRFWLLSVIILLLSLVEVASVVSILPFLRLLATPSLVETNAWLAWFYEVGGFTSSQSFLFWTGVSVLLVTILGLGMKMLTVWITTRFALMRSYSFSVRLLENYLRQPYEWFLSRHTSDLNNVVLSEVDRVVSEALLPAMRLIPEALSVLFLITALLVLEPEVAIGGTFLLCGAYGMIFLAVRRTMVRIGASRMAANQGRYRVVQDATGGLKELKILGLEGAFLGRFRSAAYQMARAQIRGQVIMTLPRQAIEAISFGGIIGLILFLIQSQGTNMADIVPTLGLVAAVGLRMIPALQQVYQRSTSLKQAAAPLSRIHADIVHLKTGGAPDLAEARQPPIGLNAALELQDIFYTYPNIEKPTLNGVSLRVDANHTIGIVGSTGAGKTTLIDIILCLLEPNSGTIVVDGMPITSGNRRTWQKSLGYVPQTIFLTDGTIAENIAFGVPKSNIDMVAVERAARVAALHHFVETELPSGYNTLVGERGVRLSGGQRQRIGIARALYTDPSIIVFDEATSALDTVTENTVMEAVRDIAGQKTILMIAHRLSTVRDCDRILVMKLGQIVASGTFEGLLEQSPDFRRMATDIRANSLS